MSTSLVTQSRASWERSPRSGMFAKTGLNTVVSEPQTSLLSELPSLLSIAMLIGLVAYLCLR